MRIVFLMTWIVVIASCGMGRGVDFESLTAMQPSVESVYPEDGSAMDPNAAIEVTFSKPVLASTVDGTTLAVVLLSDSVDRDGAVDDVLDGDMAGAEGLYEIAEGGLKVAFRASPQLKTGGSYLIIATPGILGAGLLPLNQRPGEEPEPFVSEFAVSGGAPDGSATGAVSGEGEASVERVRPDYLIINELLYDAVGSDSDGDIFVELYGEAGGDITDYKLVFINGEDGLIKDTVKMPEGSLMGEDGIFLIADARTGSPGVSDVAGADHIINFDPQNGPDCVQLLSESGELLDALGYGEPIVDFAENGMVCFEDSPADDVTSGQSLERVDTFDTDLNGGDFMANDSPTPGDV